MIVNHYETKALSDREKNVLGDILVSTGCLGFYTKLDVPNAGRSMLDHLLAQHATRCVSGLGKQTRVHHALTLCIRTDKEGITTVSFEEMS